MPGGITIGDNYRWVIKLINILEYWNLTKSKRRK